MIENLKIGDYTLIEPLKNTDAGNSRWGFAKDRSESMLYIKEFITPVFPFNTDGLEATQIKAKIDICEKFEDKKRRFYNRLKESDSGNIIFARDFFKYQSHYYIVTEAVDKDRLNVSDICGEPYEKKLVLLKSLAFSISRLHLNGIIHCDLKPANLLVKRTAEKYLTAKVIDFDSSVIEAEQDTDAELDFDTVYMSTEMLLSLFGEKQRLTEKSDIFALGLIFHEYWTGSLPELDDEYDNAAQAVLNGDTPRVSDDIPESIRSLIIAMLSREPENRPTAWKVFQTLKSGRQPDVQSQPASDQSAKPEDEPPTPEPEPPEQPESEPPEPPKSEPPVRESEKKSKAFWHDPDIF